MKLLYAILILFTSSALLGQVNKGTILLGGSFSINNNSRDRIINNIPTYSIDEERFTINPEIGWYVSKNTVLGFGVGMERGESKERERITDSFGAPTEVLSNSEFKINFFNPFINFQSNISGKLKFNLGTELRIGKGKKLLIYLQEEELNS